VKALAIGLLVAGALPALADGEAVLAADRAFSQLSAEKGETYAFWFYASRTARYYGVGGPPKIGRGADAPATDPTGGSLSWTPIAGGNDDKQGWTDGTWVMKSPQGTLSGHYLTVWIKEDGQWKVQADMGTIDPPPEPKHP
jgi:hypothetical protein